MISFTSKGNYVKTEGFLKKLSELRFEHILRKYGEKGVEALRAATPVRTGVTAASWGYKIVKYPSGSSSIIWTNSNAPYGVPVAILIQYGHATRGGGYVQGIDYINPALKPIFDKMITELDGELRTK